MQKVFMTIVLSVTVALTVADCVLFIFELSAGLAFRKLFVKHCNSSANISATFPDWEFSSISEADLGLLQHPRSASVFIKRDLYKLTIL